MTLHWNGPEDPEERSPLLPPARKPRTGGVGGKAGFAVGKAAGAVLLAALGTVVVAVALGAVAVLGLAIFWVLAWLWENLP